MRRMSALKKYIDIGANLTDDMYQGSYHGSKKHEPDLDVVLSRAWAGGLDKMIITGGSLTDSKKAIDMSKSDARLFSTVGCHPTRCTEFNESPETYLQGLRNLINENRDKVVAIGECGLDYERLNFCGKEEQLKYFEYQLPLSKEFNLPLFLHCRAAADDLVDILSRNQDNIVGGVVHSFDGSKEDLDKILPLGMFIGINGCSLRTKENLEVAATIPQNRLLIETDCPWCEVKPTHPGFQHVLTKFPSVKKEKHTSATQVKGRNEPVNIVRTAVMATPQPAAPPASEAKPPKGKGKGKKPFQRPKNKKDTLPQPENISKLSTPLTNDPLWLESFVLAAETGFTNTRAAREFEADAAGYIELVEQEYKSISDVDKYYSKSVPASAHAYYHHILYWYKIALLSQKHGTSTNAQERLVQFVQDYPSAMAGAGAAAYLTGLGDYEDATGVKHVLVATIPNEQGHFGRATAATHSLYEHHPAPAMSLQRTLEDVAKSTVRNYDDHWFINDVSPVDADIDANDEAEVMEEEALQRPRPTVNLLGWRPARTLGANQLSEMRDIFDDAQRQFTDVARTNTTFALYRPLFEFVERRIRECKRYKLATIPTNTTGSLAQQAYWSPGSTNHSATETFISQDGQLRSRTMLPMRIAVAAKVMCYRAIRREFEEDDVVTNPWSCFHYGGYRNVPQTWRKNRNTLVERGMDGLIGYAPFATTHSSRHDTLIRYLNKHKAPHVLEILAAIRNEDINELATAIYNNTNKLFFSK